MSARSREEEKAMFANMDKPRSGVSSQQLELNDPVPPEETSTAPNRMLADDDEEETGPIGELDANERAEAEKEVGSKIEKQFSFDDNLYEFENGEEWWIFKSQGEAEAKALESEIDLLETEPEILEGVLNNIGRENFVFVTETDARLLGQDEAEAQRDIIEDEVRDENPDIDEDSSEFQEIVQEKIDEKGDEIEEQLNEDPLGYFEELGFDTNDAIDQNLVQVDIEKVAQEVIDTDGLGHLLASYDGEEVETKNLLMYRTN